MGKEDFSDLYKVGLCSILFGILYIVSMVYDVAWEFYRRFVSVVVILVGINMILMYFLIKKDSSILEEKV